MITHCEFIVLKHHHKVASGLASGILTTCRQRQINIDDALQHSELSAAEVSSKYGNISAQKFSVFLDSLAEQVQDEFFGMNCAGNFRLGDSGPFGIGIMNAPSFRHAIEFYVRYLPLVVDHALFIADMGADTVLLTWSYSPFLLERTHFVDFAIYLTVRQFRLFTGSDWCPRAIRLVRQQPQQNKYLRAGFSCPIYFGAQSNAMEIAGNALQMQNPDADPRIYEHMQRLCEIELDKKFGPISLEVKISDIVANNLAGRPVTLQDVAKQVNMCSRNIQRKLTLTGTSFEKIVQNVKQEISLSMLKDTDLLIEQIAFRIGYESPNAYSRANQIWFGESPTATRHKLKSGQFQPLAQTF